MTTIVFISVHSIYFIPFPHLSIIVIQVDFVRFMEEFGLFALNGRSFSDILAQYTYISY